MTTTEGDTLPTIMTAADLRALDRAGELSDEIIHAVRLTPAARDYLNERTGTEASGEANDTGRTRTRHHANRAGDDAFAHDGFTFHETGERTAVKPEAYTHIAGSTLVMKDHPRIVLRGGLDHLQSILLECQLVAVAEGYFGLKDDLEEILAFVRRILRAEVCDEPIPGDALTILGMDAPTLRRRSHDPKDHFGIGHIVPSWRHGPIMIRLNTLRTATRAVERDAVRVFRCDPEEPDARATVTREDIVTALNRLSSLVYILMLWLESGHYQRCKSA